MGREEEVRRLGDQPGGCGTGTIRRNASVGLVEVAGLGGGVCVCVCLRTSLTCRMPGQLSSKVFEPVIFCDLKNPQ